MRQPNELPETGIRKDLHRTIGKRTPQEIGKMASTTEKDLEKDLEAIRADIRALSDTVGKLASEAAKTQETITRTVRKAAHRVADAGEDFVGEAAHLGREARDAAADAAEVSLSAVEREIKRNPVGAVLVALGVGFLVGIIGHR
jgi:ElaB/YqjD/DUF883 family membrane-anchored ribosome-binding protein